MRLSMTTEGGASDCEVGDTGDYQVTFSEQATKIVLSEPRDPCFGRQKDLRDPDGLTRREPQG